MGMFDFLRKQQDDIEKFSNPDYLKMDVEISTRVKKRLTSVEGTVKEMKAYEAKLQHELQQAEDFKYGKEEKPDYTGKGFEAFLSTVDEYTQSKVQAKTVETVKTEQAEFERYKKQFIAEKVGEIEADLCQLKSQQTAKLRDIEDTFETAENTADIDELYSVIVAEYHSLNRRTEAISNYGHYYHGGSRERIEREGLAGREKRARKAGVAAANYAANYMAAHSGGGK